MIADDGFPCNLRRRQTRAGETLQKASRNIIARQQRTVSDADSMADFPMQTYDGTSQTLDMKCNLVKRDDSTRPDDVDDASKQCDGIGLVDEHVAAAGGVEFSASRDGLVGRDMKFDLPTTAFFGTDSGSLNGAALSINCHNGAVFAHCIREQQRDISKSAPNVEHAHALPDAGFADQSPRNPGN
jgi:hypothetical protein